MWFISLKRVYLKLCIIKEKNDSIRFHVRCFIWKYNVDTTLKSSCPLSVRYQHYGKPPSFLSSYLHQYNFAVLDYYIVSSFFALRLPTFAFAITVQQRESKKAKKERFARSNFHKTALFNFVSTCPTKLVTKSLQTKIRSVHVKYSFSSLLQFSSSKINTVILNVKLIEGFVE